MDDTTRKQVIEALEPFARAHEGTSQIYVWMSDHAEMKAAHEALTALKAIQPRPDVVVAARKFVERIRRYPHCSVEYALESAGGSLEAALADEQEWEVQYAGGHPNGGLSPPFESRQDLIKRGWDSENIFPVYIPKAKPQPVSREKAVEEAARQAHDALHAKASELRKAGIDGDYSVSAYMERVADTLEAALSREVQP